MSSNNYVGFVHGFLPNIDLLSKAAKRLALPFRCTIILDRGGVEDNTNFNLSIYQAILERFWQTFQPSMAHVTKEKGPEKNCLSIEEIYELCQWSDPDDMEPLEMIRFIRDGVTVGLVESEPWANYGGPGPYADNYGLAIFTKKDQFEEIYKSVAIGLDAIGARKGKIHEGVEKETISVFTRMIWLLG